RPRVPAGIKTGLREGQTAGISPYFSRDGIVVGGEVGEVSVVMQLSVGTVGRRKTPQAVWLIEESWALEPASLGSQARVIDWPASGPVKSRFDRNQCW